MANKENKVIDLKSELFEDRTQEWLSLLEREATKIKENNYKVAGGIIIAAYDNYPEGVLMAHGYTSMNLWELFGYLELEKQRILRAEGVT